MGDKKCIKVPFGRKMNHASILLVSESDDLVHMLASKLLENKRFSLKVHLANELPLEMDEECICEADLAVFIIDVANRTTFASAKKSLSYLPNDFYHGRLLIIAHNELKCTERLVEPEEVSLLAKECLCYVLWDTIAHDNTFIVDQLVNRLSVVTGATDMSVLIHTAI